MVSLLNWRANKLKNLFFVICWHVNAVMPPKQKQPKKTCYNPLSPEDLNFIKLIFEEKGWYGAKICREFPSKNWNPVTVNKNIKKLRETGSIHRKPGTGLYDGNRSVCTNENMEIVMIWSNLKRTNPEHTNHTRKLQSRLAEASEVLKEWWKAAVQIRFTGIGRPKLKKFAGTFGLCFL